MSPDNIMFYPAIVILIVEAGALAFLIWAWFDAKRKRGWIREWNISYEIHDGAGGLIPGMVVLPSFRKAFWWFIRTGRKCCHIYIWQSGMKIDKEEL